MKSKQMSEAMVTTAFLTVSGGLKDAYTYCCRGEVFANAQTGNIVLMGANLFSGRFAAAAQYLVPIVAFTLGIFAAVQIRRRFQQLQWLHWRQMVLLGEIALLALVGLFPQSWNAAANAVISFVCALQVQSFRKVANNAYASTMCTGNLRSGVEALCLFLHGRDWAALHRAGAYFAVIGFFILGAGLGAVLTGLWHERTIWLSCALLAVSFLLMFRQEKEEEKNFEIS